MTDTPSSDHPPRRGRGGRPRADDGARLSVAIRVRFSPAERAAVQEKAARAGVTVAAFLRDAALSRRQRIRPVPEVNRQAYAELARLAANLNQLAHRANSDEAVSVDGMLLQQTIGELRTLRLALLGVEEGGGDDC